MQPYSDGSEPCASLAVIEKALTKEIVFPLGELNFERPVSLAI